jgi:stearoyl-CoA desaturase (Delta-9 desaturase)
VNSSLRLPATPPRPSFGQYFNVVGILAIHGGTIYAFYRGVTWKLAAFALASYFIRMFAITAVYHRYFSHRSYKTSRPFQLFLALLGTTATQKGPLWWASTHRVHHKHSDTERDVHSPMRRGFWWSHMGWWLSREHENGDMALIPDFAGYPELRWVEKWCVLGPLAMIAATLAFGGFDVFLWAYVVSTCALMHGTFTINSLSHVFGSRRYATTDTSRNNFLLALITMGEGWHNNHHHYMSSANQGFFWWEIDVSFYILKGLEKLGLVWDLRAVPEHMKKRNLLRDVGERAPLLMKKPAAEAPSRPQVGEAPEPDLG